MRMVPTIDRSKATRMIKVGFLKMDDRILPDMSAKVAFLEGKLNPTSTRPRLAISKEALLQVNGKFYFFINRRRYFKSSRNIKSSVHGLGPNCC